ncbi:MAG TPA: SAM-dependent chlorinase/fluorinase [Candidatus Stackebrandtia excrementipullorum]|nr:SAM-dependent chlorinase/fluorinase [Candidatus Stackebrandtia excrementipullorum]
MSGYPIISLTTDYGLADGFVGACHGVIARWSPQSRIIDISHEIPGGDITRGALVLAQTVPYLPTGVHMAVVDPGVGTTRRPVAVETENGVLVGPDNGLLPWAADELGGARRAVTLTESRFHRHPVSHTFHGRDIFAPVAAVLAAGVAITDLGQSVAVTDLIRLPEPIAILDEDALVAQVMHIDRFGNLQLSADRNMLDDYGETFDVNGHRAVRGDMFAAASLNALVILIDSAGKVAVAVNGGSAATYLGIECGDVLRLEAVKTSLPQRFRVVATMHVPHLTDGVGQSPQLFGGRGKPVGGRLPVNLGRMSEGTLLGHHLGGRSDHLLVCRHAGFQPFHQCSV